MPSKHVSGMQNEAEFHGGPIQESGSPDGQNAQQRLRPEPSPALFLVKSGAKTMWSVPSKGKPMIVRAKRSGHGKKNSWRQIDMYLPQLQQTQGRGPSLMVAFALLGWFAHALEVWLQHR